MVKLLCLAVFRRVKNGAPIQIAYISNLSDVSRWTALAANPHMRFVMRTLVQRLKESTESVFLEHRTAHILVQENGLSICAITDPDYPQAVAFDLLNQTARWYVKDFPNWHEHVEDNYAPKFMEDLLAKFQHPADRLMHMRKELQESKGQTVKTVDQILDKGESLESLAKTSKDMDSRMGWNVMSRTDGCKIL